MCVSIPFLNQAEYVFIRTAGFENNSCPIKRFQHRSMAAPGDFYNFWSFANQKFWAYIYVKDFDQNDDG